MNGGSGPRSRKNSNYLGLSPGIYPSETKITPLFLSLDVRAEEFVPFNKISFNIEAKEFSPSPVIEKNDYKPEIANFIDSPSKSKEPATEIIKIAQVPSSPPPEQEIQEEAKEKTPEISKNIEEEKNFSKSLDQKYAYEAEKAINEEKKNRNKMQ